jgi:hypothetical protein
MKKIFTLIIGSLFSLSLLAYDGSRLSVSTTTNSIDLRIEIDGRKVNSDAYRDGNSITISHISEGTHNIRIFREKKNAFGFNKRPEIIYASNLLMKRGFHTEIMVNRFGKVFVDECRIAESGDFGYQDEDQNEGWDNPYANVLSTRDFEMVKDQLRREWSENNRLVSAKVITDKSYFTTQQVKELMQLFSFESNKLEIAKYAYRKTADKQNYFQVEDGLVFKSSKDELARFVREKP